MPTISVTRLRLRKWRFWPAFIFGATRAAAQAKRADGNLNVALRGVGRVYWTMTAWRDAGALRAFMLAGSHRRSMPKLANWCDEASLVRFEHAGDTPPSWAEAERILAEQGRTSKVDHPTPAHRAGSTVGDQGQARIHAPTAL